jgi:hypothetical protein
MYRCLSTQTQAGRLHTMPQSEHICVSVHTFGGFVQSEVFRRRVAG